MFTLRTTWLAAFALGLGCLLLPGLDVGAGDKKTDDKKKQDGPKTNSQFKTTPIELKLKDGKVSYAGELTDKDVSVQKHYFKVFTVQLEKGKTYRIDHRDRGGDPKF